MMNVSFFLFVARGLILFGACGMGVSGAEGKGTQPDADPDVGNKQVLADTFRDLVRYAMLKTYRDAVKFGVTPGNFSVEAMGESLANRANAEVSEDRGAVSLTRLLKKAHEPLEGSGCSGTTGGSVRSLVRTGWRPEGEAPLALSARAGPDFASSRGY